jgi:hypothetical protein
MKHGQATGGQNTVAYRVAQRISNNLYKYLPIKEHKKEEIKEFFLESLPKLRTHTVTIIIF